MSKNRIQKPKVTSPFLRGCAAAAAAVITLMLITGTASSYIVTQVLPAIFLLDLISIAMFGEPFIFAGTATQEKRVAAMGIVCFGLVVVLRKSMSIELEFWMILDFVVTLILISQVLRYAIFKSILFPTRIERADLHR
jgi:hypothetical protein